MFRRWARLEAATGSRTGLHVLWFNAEYVAAIAPYERHRQTQAALRSKDRARNQETQAIPWPNEVLRGAWAESVGSGPGRRSTSVSVPVPLSIADEGPRAAYETAGPVNTQWLKSSTCAYPDTDGISGHCFWNDHTNSEHDFTKWNLLLQDQQGCRCRNIYNKPINQINQTN